MVRANNVQTFYFMFGPVYEFDECRLNRILQSCAFCISPVGTPTRFILSLEILCGDTLKPFQPEWKVALSMRGRAFPEIGILLLIWIMSAVLSTFRPIFCRLWTQSRGAGEWRMRIIDFAGDWNLKGGLLTSFTFTLRPKLQSPRLPGQRGGMSLWWCQKIGRPITAKMAVLFVTKSGGPCAERFVSLLCICRFRCTWARPWRDLQIRCRKGWFPMWSIAVFRLLKCRPLKARQAAL